MDETPKPFKLRPGDQITLDVPVKRRWWHIWSPKFIARRQTFVVTDWSAS